MIQQCLDFCVIGKTIGKGFDYGVYLDISVSRTGYQLPFLQLGAATQCHVGLLQKSTRLLAPGFYQENHFAIILHPFRNTLGLEVGIIGGVPEFW